MVDLPEASPNEKKRRIGLQQNDYCDSLSSCSSTTIHGLPNEILGLTLSLLGGRHFRYAPLACKMFLGAYLASLSADKITTGKSVTSSISCTKKYFYDAQDYAHLFWTSAVRYGRVEVMEWAHQEGHAIHKWHGSLLCAEAAKYGQLQALRWLRANHQRWDCQTISDTACYGHLNIFSIRDENGCHWDSSKTCSVAVRHGHLSILQYVRDWVSLEHF